MLIMLSPVAGLRRSMVRCWKNCSRCDKKCQQSFTKRYPKTCICRWKIFFGSMLQWKCFIT